VCSRKLHIPVISDSPLPRVRARSARLDSSFRPYPHSGAIKEFAVYRLQGSFANYSFQFPLGGSGVGQRSMTRPPGAHLSSVSSHTSVHGFVGQPISILIVFAEGVADRKPLQLRD